MRRFLIFIMYILVCVSVNAVSSVPTPRVSVFSTTVDWSAVTGLGLYQYTGVFKGENKDLLKNGVVLYYLDSFPCYGEADSVRLWFDKKGKTDNKLRLVCVHKPDIIKFAYKNADRDASDTKTEGIVECSVSGNRDFVVDFKDCVRGKNWAEYL